MILAGRKADQGKAAVQEVKAEARLRNKKVASKCVCFKVAFPPISLSLILASGVFFFWSP